MQTFPFMNFTDILKETLCHRIETFERGRPRSLVKRKRTLTFQVFGVVLLRTWHFGWFSAGSVKHRVERCWMECGRSQGGKTISYSAQERHPLHIWDGWETNKLKRMQNRPQTHILASGNDSTVASPVSAVTDHWCDFFFRRTDTDQMVIWCRNQISDLNDLLPSMHWPTALLHTPPTSNWEITLSSLTSCKDCREFQKWGWGQN